MLLDSFPDRQKLMILPDATTESVIIKRVAKSTTRFNVNYTFDATLQDDTLVSNGDLVTIEGEKYFVVARRNSYLSKSAQLYKSNCSVTIVRLVKQYIGTSWTGKWTEQVLHENVPALYQDITGKMQQFDSGLLSTSTRKFILPKLEGIQLLDRVKMLTSGGIENGQIDVLNTTEYEGLYSTQTQPDKRVVV